MRICTSRPLTAVLAGASLVGAVALAASPAQAYPAPPAGSASGVCTPSQQQVQHNSLTQAVSCTFTFTTSGGAPVAPGQTVAFSSQGTNNIDANNIQGLQSSTGTTDASGQATAVIGSGQCGAVSTTNYQVTATLNGSDATASGQAFASVTCTKQQYTVTPQGCQLAPWLAQIPGFTSYECLFQTDAPSGDNVYYQTSGNAFQYGGSTNALYDGSGTFFYANVYADSGNPHGYVKGSVDGTGDGLSGSASQSF